METRIIDIKNRYECRYCRKIARKIIINNRLERIRVCNEDVCLNKAMRDIQHLKKEDC